MDAQLPKHLSFLNDGAHLLRAVAPETSAYLMRHRAGLLLDNSIDTNDLHRQQACAACGHIMLPGQGSNLSLDASAVHRFQKRKTKRPPTAAEREKPASNMHVSSSTRPALRKAIECGLCHERTVIKLPPPPVLSRRNRPAKGTKSEPAKPKLPSTMASEPLTSVKTAANASSKKRAKNRKAGLQALLSQSTQGSRSLSLADLARK